MGVALAVASGVPLAGSTINGTGEPTAAVGKTTTLPPVDGVHAARSSKRASTKNEIDSVFHR
jgi:hypothetical protein